MFRHCVHHYFENQVITHGQDLAIQLGSQCLSYKALDERANQLAHFLIAHGVVRETRIAIRMERSIEMIVSILAIFKAGAAYVPIAIDNPQFRVNQMIEQSKSSFFITRTRDSFAIPLNHDLKVICLDEYFSHIEALPKYSPQVFVSRENLAYVIFTSGSTGMPKGVMMEHGPLADIIGWHSKQFPALRTLGFASFAFDVSTQEVFSALCTGGSLFLADQDDRLSPEKLISILRDNAIQCVFMPFTPLSYLVKALDGKPVLKDLTTIFTSGEAVRITAEIRGFLDRHECCRLHIQYGATECHTVTDYCLPIHSSVSVQTVSIGMEIHNATIRIVDARFRPVPDGEDGQILVMGESLARGYTGVDPENRFCEHEVTNGDWQRVYCTGDRGRRETDGTLTYLGRLDEQVKIQGYRIELSEVAQNLVSHPDVHLAIVDILKPLQDESMRLIAFISPVSGRTLHENELRQFMASRLPSYMIPAVFDFLDEFPVTSNGKVNRTLLIDDFLKREKVQCPEPQSETESFLIECLNALFSTKNFCVTDNFQRSGGDSVKATMLGNRIAEKFGGELDVKKIYQADNITHLAQMIDEDSKNNAGL